MAKVRKIEAEESLSTANSKHLNVRVPLEWMSILSVVLEEKKDQHGSYRMTDLIREAIYQVFVRPAKAA